MARGCWLSLLLTSVACQGALDLDGYTFQPAGGAAGSGGAGGSTPEPIAGAGGSAGNGGSGGGNGSSGAGGSGGSFDAPDASAGAAGDSGNTPELDGGTDGGGSGLGCAPAEQCVPVIPVGWDGPISVESGADCPSAYPAEIGELNAGLQVGASSCACGCVVNGVTCHLESKATGEFFDPATCESPPTEDDCMIARSVAGCSALPSSSINPNTWQTTALSCGGGVSTGGCDGGGECYPSLPGSAPLCVHALGDLTCPEGFPDRQVFFQDIADSRVCSGCTCSTSGQACQIEVEVCSVGFFTQTLGEGEEICLNSSDGDGIHVLTSALISQGTCATAGGVASGEAVPADPVTVCCIE